MEKSNHSTAMDREHIQFYNMLDLDELMKSNVLVSGCNSTGKSRLSSALASVLQKFNWQVICFDNVGVWKQISDIPLYHKMAPIRNANPYFPIVQTPIVDDSIIYDTSLLLPSEQVKFVDDFLQHLWNARVETKPNQWLLLIFEEAQLYMKNVRTTIAENLLRIMTCGRNYRVRALAITVDLALLDSAFIRLCQQRYHGKIGIEENSKRKFRAYYGLDYTRIACEGLETGDFLYVNKSKLQVIHAPLFEPRTKPIPYREPQKPSILAKIKRLFT